MAKYPMMSPYVAFNNNPVYFVDPYGLEGDPPKPEGAPENAKYNDIFTDKSGGTWTYLDIGNGEGAWKKSLDEVVVKPGERNNGNNDISNVLGKAKEFVDANVTGETYATPSTTTSIEKIKSGEGGIDCSAFINESFKQSGYEAPNNYKPQNSGTKVGDKGSWGNGVALIIDGLPIVDKDDLQIGDLVTFKSSRDDHKGPDGAFDHIGIVQSVKTNKQGTVISITYYDSGGSNSTARKKKAKDPNTPYKAGPRMSTYDFSKTPCESCNKFRGAYRPGYKKKNKKT
jgi:hypothetical protein